MNKLLFLSAISALAASASIPVVENGANPSGRSFQHSARIMAADAAYTFFEGFESRPGGYGNSADEWLPDGWQDLSKSGETVSNDRHNLTWRVLENQSRANAPTCANYAFEGDCFAFIMADVAYGTHLDLKEQDEWLITPAMTVAHEDWLNFQLFYNAAWTVYNRAANDFSAQNNTLEVYASTDDGKHWAKIWSLIDDEIRVKWTDKELRDLLTGTPEFTPIFVNLKDYEGQQVKLAFRYFGNYGHPMAIDNVMVGVPEPQAKYVLPGGFFKQGLSPHIDYPQKPSLLIPHLTEATWLNKCSNFLSCDWTYTAADGSAATSQATDLITPAYAIGSVASTPSLTASFESRVSTPWQQGHTRMQAGGILSGSDDSGQISEFGISHYDISDPTHRFVITRDLVGFHRDLDLQWEMRLGRMDGSLDVAGYANFFAASPVAYGFDFVDMVAYVPDPLDSDGMLQLQIYKLDREGMPEQLLGETWIDASNIPFNATNYVNFHFTFPVPVYVPANSDIITLLVHSEREKDEIYLPYVKTQNPEKLGNSLLYVWAYDNNLGDWYDTFYNLNNMALNDDYYFGGLVQSLGASYSDMTLTEGPQSIVVPKEGGDFTFKVDATHPSERIKLTENGCYEPEWATYTIGEDCTVNVHIGPAAANDDVATQLHIVSPGSRVSIDVLRTGDPDFDTIHEITAPDAAAPTFDLSGRRVIAPSRGLYIRGNQKLLLQ